MVKWRVSGRAMGVPSGADSLNVDIDMTGTSPYVVSYVERGKHALALSVAHECSIDDIDSFRHKWIRHR